MLHTASINFLREPTDISVYEGESAKFDCSFTGSDEVPFWGINGTYYDYSELPPGYTISQSDFSLTIVNVNIAMNRTSLNCFIGGEESNTAFLYVYSNVTVALIHATTSVSTNTEGIIVYDRIHNINNIV